MTGELEAGLKETRAALAALKSAAHPPLAVYFSPKRQLPGQPRSLPGGQPFEPSIAYGQGLHDREVELRGSSHWFRTQGWARPTSHAALRCWTRCGRAVSDLVPEFNNLRIQEQPAPLASWWTSAASPFTCINFPTVSAACWRLCLTSPAPGHANPDSDNPIADGWHWC